MEITPITPNSFLESSAVERQTGTDVLSNVGRSFGEVLNSLTESQNNADDLMTQLAQGEDVEIHDAMIAVEENDINFRIAMSVRSKLVEAYREIMRMSV